MNLDALRAQISDLVRDKDQVVSSDSLDAAIAAAVLRYSSDRPRAVVVDVVSPGGSELALPAGWDELSSRVTLLETPVDMDPPAELDLAQVRFRARPDGTRLALAVSLASNQVVRIGYTQPHVVDAQTSTIPDGHRLPVACYAASLVCGQLASFYATEGMPSIGADVTDHQGKTERFRARARDLAGQYTSLLGINDRKTVSAGVVTSMQGRDSDGGRRLFHDKRYRR